MSSSQGKAAAGGAAINARRILWSHRSDSQFLVASHNELRLLEYTPQQEDAAQRHRERRRGAHKDANSLYKTVAVTSDLPGFKVD